MAALKVRKECLESEVHYGYNNSSYAVVLKNATIVPSLALYQLEKFVPVIAALSAVRVTVEATVGM